MKYYLTELIIFLLNNPFLSLVVFLAFVGLLVAVFRNKKK